MKITPGSSMGWSLRSQKKFDQLCQKGKLPTDLVWLVISLGSKKESRTYFKPFSLVDAMMAHRWGGCGTDSHICVLRQRN